MDESLGFIKISSFTFETWKTDTMYRLDAQRSYESSLKYQLSIFATKTNTKGYMFPIKAS